MLARWSEDLLRHGMGQTSLKTLRPFCTNSLSGLPIPALVAAVQESRNCCGYCSRKSSAGLLPRIVNCSIRACAVSLALHDDGGADIPENEVGVPVAEVQVAAADFRVEDQDGAGAARSRWRPGLLDAEGGGGAGHVHIEAVNPRCRARPAFRPPWRGRGAACWKRRR